MIMVLISVLAVADLRAGESIHGFPNWEERVILTWINRARSDPQADLSRCGGRCVEAACYQPVPPLMWSEALNRAARFHADEMQRQGYFAHDSRCTLVPNISALYPVGCDGAASCACVGGGPSCVAGLCTPWAQRIALFGASPYGEIMAPGSDPDAAFYLWLFAPSSSAACGVNGSNIHRWLILSAAGGVGVGMNGVAVADFGSGGTPHRIPSGSHYPRQAPSIEVWANWFDASPPRSASVVIDGQCVPMTLRRGSGTNGSWSATVRGAGSGCHRYYFSFVDGSGLEVTYPATGSLGIGCEDWDSSREQARCSDSSNGKRRAVRR